MSKAICSAFYRSCLVLALGLALAACGRSSSTPEGSTESAEHAGEPEGEHHDETGPIELSEEAMARAGIKVDEVRGVAAADVLLAPADLEPNADRMARVGPRVSGRIANVAVSLGAVVKEGQALATIRSPQAAEATAVLDSARAAEKLAQASLARERDLFQRKVSAQREVLEAEAALARAQADVKAAEARLATMGFDAGSAAGADPVVTVTSPIGGTVIERNAAADAPVQPDSVLFTIADLRTLWLTVRVPETSTGSIRRGQKVRITVRALPDQPIDGTVDYVAPIVTAATRTVDVRLQVPNAQGALRPGMSATARFDIAAVASAAGAGDRLLIPRAAVQELNQATVVFVAEGERRFEARPITLGSTYGSDVEVLSGLEAGDRIVVRGAFTLKAQAVRGAAADPH
jgi:cobalt-zinc-cadmium efflux system membrane fusion protein